MLTRRLFLTASAGGLLSLAGCGRRRATAPNAPAIIPVTTVVDPARAAAAPQIASVPVRFTDVSAQAGLRWAFNNGGTGRHLFVESTGGGVALFDYNNDGLLDVFALQGGPVPGAKGAELNFSTRSALYRNNGDGTFTDVTTQAGLGRDFGYGQGVSVADYDNDGWPDLYLTAYGGNRLLHNNGDGTFTDVTLKAGLDKLQGKSMGAVWTDYDGDGRPDLFVTNDTMPNFLLHNNRDGTFTDRGIGAGMALDDQGEALSGMGIGAGDYDNDGREDLFVVNFSGEPKTVFHNTGQGLFESAAYPSGLASTNLQFLGFGLECFDYDLDGYRDLIYGNGHVLDRMDQDTAGSSYAQSQQLFHNGGGGTFTEDLRSLGDLALPRVTRGLAVGDYDNDGDVDVVMVSQAGPLQLFRNDGGNANGWITLRLEGVQSNRDALGAKVTIHTRKGRQSAWVHGSSSYCSHSDTRLTFGLGKETSIQSLEVLWPSGKRQTFGPLAGRRFYWLREGGSPLPDPRILASRKSS